MMRIRSRQNSIGHYLGSHITLPKAVLDALAAEDLESFRQRALVKLRKPGLGFREAQGLKPKALKGTNP